MTALPLPAVRARFSLLHAILGVTAWILAGALIFLVTFLGSDRSENRPAIAATTALSAPLGPLSAGVARHGQSCCVRFAANCLPFSLPFLLIAFLPLLARPVTPRWRALNYVAWTSGLFLWCASGLFPLVVHSLN